MADEQTTGTPGAEQEGANAAEAVSGTPAASTDGGNAGTVDADELESLRRFREQALAEKETLERVKRENEYLRQQAEQANRAYQPPTGYDPAAQQAARLAQTLQNLNERDPEVVELITATARMTQEQLVRQQNEQRFFRELDAIPSEDRAEVERISRAENLWPSIANDRLLARRYAKEKAEIAEQRRKLQEDQQRRERGVVKTTASPAPTAPKGDEITSDEHDRLIAAAERGDRDARKKLDDVDYGRIRIRSG